MKIGLYIFNMGNYIHICVVAKAYLLYLVLLNMFEIAYNSQQNISSKPTKSKEHRAKGDEPR